MKVLNIENLNKKYEKFELKNISFSLDEGKIVGFIGRNGAGKTTAIKSIMNFIQIDDGDITFFEKYNRDNINKIKKYIGFVSGGIDYYSLKPIKVITSVTKRFYDNWDDEAYKDYMNKFNIDENKKPCELSEGMKVKYSLILALSHNAKLLIFDEPTSGLDPVSREELLDIFLELINKEKVTIFFSTHITSDLERCADNIIYIKNGKIILNETYDDLLNKFKCVRINKENYKVEDNKNLIGIKETKYGYEGIIKAEEKLKDYYELINTDLENIMIHLERDENNEKYII